MARVKRHDDISHERQQKLAALLVLVNLFVGGISTLFILATDWNLELTRSELVCIAVLIVVSWLNLLVAAGFIGWVVDLVLSMLPDGTGTTEPSPDAALLKRHRMAFYYVGVWANLLALGLIIEVTGGLAESPFIALLIAFVLTGQQLSRFRMQSGLLYASGLALVALMIALEPLSTQPAEPAPHELTIAVAILALAAGGLLNFIEKPHNYLLEKHVKQPSRARIYQDGRGVWRVTLLEKVHRLDPVIFARVEAGTAVEGKFPAGLKERFESLLNVMAEDAGWTTLKPNWPDRCSANFIVGLERQQAGQP
jgi:hypothetical protein